MSAEYQQKNLLILLDRDGTINIDHGYVTKPEQMELIPGVAEAIGCLKREGAQIVVVSNQSAVGRGWAKPEEVEATNQRMKDLLLKQCKEAVIDLVLWSPDSPDMASNTRKPEIGLVREESSLWPLKPDLTWVIGDKPSDIEFGKNLGLPLAHCLLVLSSPEADKSNESVAKGVKRFRNLADAVAHILDILSARTIP